VCVFLWYIILLILCTYNVIYEQTIGEHLLHSKQYSFTFSSSIIKKIMFIRDYFAEVIKSPTN